MKQIDLINRTESGTIKKVIIWHPVARASIKSFPEEIRVKIGYLFYLLQIGESLKMPQSRPMSNIGIGVQELRAKDRTGIFRVLYFAKFEHGIHIFHAFQKKTEKTPDAEIRLGKKRLKELIGE